MLIAVLDLQTTPADRTAVLAQFDGESDEIRSMPGNISFQVYVARHDDGAVAVIHQWTDEASFADYLSSDAFARSSAVVRPLMTQPPVSRRYRAELLETV